MKHDINETVSPYNENSLHPKTDEIPHTHMGKRHMQRLLTQGVLLFVILSGLATTVYFIKTPQDTRQFAAANGPKLSIEPSHKQTKAGESFPLALTLSTGDDTVSAVELHLTYDPSTLQVISFKEGDKFPMVLEKESHVNGAINVTLGTQPATPFVGTTIIGTLTVKQLVNKASKVAFASTTKVASIGKTTNTLAGTGEVEISLQGGGSASLPTPTPSLGDNNQRVLVPIPTPQDTGGELTYTTPTNNSFGSLTNTSQPPVTTTNYIPQEQTITHPPSVPQGYTPLPSSTPTVKSTNFIENFFISIGTILQALFSSFNNGD